jgi:hypothetical protein
VSCEPCWARWLLRAARARLNVSIGATCHCELQTRLRLHFRCSVHTLPHPTPPAVSSVRCATPLAAPTLPFPSPQPRVARAHQGPRRHPLRGRPL